MSRHFKDVPYIEDGDDGLDAVDSPSIPAARIASTDELGRLRTSRPTTGSFSNGDTTGFLAVVSEADTARDARRRYKRNTKKSAHFASTDPYDIHGYRKGRGGKGKKAARVISTLLFVAGVILLLVAGFLWLRAQWAYHQQDVEVQRKQGFVTISDDPYTAPVVNWLKLKADNDDVVGWVQIPGTAVNFPVYQGEDNDEYLHTSSEGEYALGGEIFLDYANTAPGMVDNQSIIYGHHLRNGAMFKAVADMDSQSFFDSIETVWYCTQDETYELVPLMSYYADPYDTSVRQFSFDSVEDFRNYLGEILNKSVTFRADADQVISNCDHVLTLVTCNYLDELGGDGRTIVICVPKSELPAPAGE